jgi:peroxiredoxin Q/BCP
MLATGTQAPAFALLDDEDHLCKLQDVLKKGPLILYFYPADFTPGCTREACSLRDLHDDLVATGLTVLGVSPQSTESHRRFRAKHKLPFNLLSDPDKTVIKAYDSDGPFGISVRRTSYLIGSDGRIRDGLVADFGVKEHTKFFQQAIDLKR